MLPSVIKDCSEVLSVCLFTQASNSNSDDSVYRKYRCIVFDIDISYCIVKKILNF